LVLELCRGGDLNQWVEDPRNASVPMGPRLEWLLQIARAMLFLHDRSPAVLHRDLKPSNVLVSEQGAVQWVCAWWPV
jgi:serine/threonine protein kinase